MSEFSDHLFELGESLAKSVREQTPITCPYCAARGQIGPRCGACDSDMGRIEPPQEVKAPDYAWEINQIDNWMIQNQSSIAEEVRNYFFWSAVSGASPHNIQISAEIAVEKFVDLMSQGVKK